MLPVSAPRVVQGPGPAVSSVLRTAARAAPWQSAHHVFSPIIAVAAAFVASVSSAESVPNVPEKNAETSSTPPGAAGGASALSPPSAEVDTIDMNVSPVRAQRISTTTQRGRKMGGGGRTEGRDEEADPAEAPDELLARPHRHRAPPHDHVAHEHLSVCGCEYIVS